MDPQAVPEQPLTKSNITTVDEAKAIANDAASLPDALMRVAQKLYDNTYPNYGWAIMKCQEFTLIGIKESCSTAHLGSDYFGSRKSPILHTHSQVKIIFKGFKEQVSDKCHYEDSSWEANKIYISNFVKDTRGSQLNEAIDWIMDWFDGLPGEVYRIRQEFGPDIGSVVDGQVPKVLSEVTDVMSKCEGFGKSWKPFYNDIVLVHENAEIAVDSATKSGIIRRVKALGDDTQMLSQAMGAYEQVLKDKLFRDRV